MSGGGAFGSAAWGTQDDWALTASPAPQRGDTPLQLALKKGHEEVAKVLGEAIAIEKSEGSEIGDGASESSENSF